ncbi:MAG: hypothetical protein KDD76_02775 [Rickettsiales bacterium]|nr:hypothetical protein [Rickettsiales bacterium]
MVMLWKKQVVYFIMHFIVFVVFALTATQPMLAEAAPDSLFPIETVITRSELSASLSGNTINVSLKSQSHYGGNSVSGPLLYQSSGVVAVNQNTSPLANTQQSVTITYITNQK